MRRMVPEFDAVVRDQAAFVMKVVRRMGVPDRYVEDVSQEVFLVLHRRWNDYDPSRPLQPWIYGIATRTAVAHRRRAFHRRERLDSSPDLPPVEAAQERTLRHTEAQRLLDRALDTLDDDKRQVFVAFDLLGIPMAEIAVTLGCPLQTAYSRLHAARRRVRDEVERATMRSAV